jgi:hypothetical protein
MLTSEFFDVDKNTGINIKALAISYQVIVAISTIFPSLQKMVQVDLLN